MVAYLSIKYYIFLLLFVAFFYYGTRWDDACK
jgi:hypothetical protein